MFLFTETIANKLRILSRDEEIRGRLSSLCIESIYQYCETRPPPLFNYRIVINSCDSVSLVLSLILWASSKLKTLSELNENDQSALINTLGDSLCCLANFCVDEVLREYISTHISISVTKDETNNLILDDLNSYNDIECTFTLLLAVVGDIEKSLFNTSFISQHLNKETQVDNSKSHNYTPSFPLNLSPLHTASLVRCLSYTTTILSNLFSTAFDGEEPISLDSLPLLDRTSFTLSFTELHAVEKTISLTGIITVLLLHAFTSITSLQHSYINLSLLKNISNIDNASNTPSDEDVEQEKGTTLLDVCKETLGLCVNQLAEMQLPDNITTTLPISPLLLPLTIAKDIELTLSQTVTPQSTTQNNTVQTQNTSTNFASLFSPSQHTFASPSARPSVISLLHRVVANNCVLFSDSDTYSNSNHSQKRETTDSHKSLFSVVLPTLTSLCSHAVTHTLTHAATLPADLVPPVIAMCGDAPLALATDILKLTSVHCLTEDDTKDGKIKASSKSSPDQVVVTYVNSETVDLALDNYVSQAVLAGECEEDEEEENEDEEKADYVDYTPSLVVGDVIQVCLQIVLMGQYAADKQVSHHVVPLLQHLLRSRILPSLAIVSGHLQHLLNLLPHSYSKYQQTHPQDQLPLYTRAVLLVLQPFMMAVNDMLSLMQPVTLSPALAETLIPSASHSHPHTLALLSSLYSLLSRLASDNPGYSLIAYSENPNSSVPVSHDGIFSFYRSLVSQHQRYNPSVSPDNSQEDEVVVMTHTFHHRAIAVIAYIFGHRNLWQSLTPSNSNSTTKKNNKIMAKVALIKSQNKTSESSSTLSTSSNKDSAPLPLASSVKYTNNPSAPLPLLALDSLYLLIQAVTNTLTNVTSLTLSNSPSNDSSLTSENKRVLAGVDKLDAVDACLAFIVNLAIIFDPSSTPPSPSSPRPSASPSLSLMKKYRECWSLFFSQLSPLMNSLLRILSVSWLSTEAASSHSDSEESVIDVYSPNVSEEERQALEASTTIVQILKQIHDSQIYPLHCECWFHDIPAYVLQRRLPTTQLMFLRSLRTLVSVYRVYLDSTTSQTSSNQPELFASQSIRDTLVDSLIVLTSHYCPIPHIKYEAARVFAAVVTLPRNSFPISTFLRSHSRFDQSSSVFESIITLLLNATNSGPTAVLFKEGQEAMRVYSKMI